MRFSQVAFSFSDESNGAYIDNQTTDLATPLCPVHES